MAEGAAISKSSEYESSGSCSSSFLSLVRLASSASCSSCFMSAVMLAAVASNVPVDPDGSGKFSGWVGSVTLVGLSSVCVSSAVSGFADASGSGSSSAVCA